MIKTVLKFAVPILIIAGGFMVTGWMLSTPQRAERQEIPEKVTPVTYINVNPVDETIFVEAQGTVMPARSIVLMPEVVGKVTSVSPDLIPGGYLRKGQQVLQIDKRDYEFALETARERVAKAQFQLKVEKGQQTVARQEWELLEDSVPTTDAGKELALRKPHIESAESTLKSAQSGLEKAKLDLERTSLQAPFNAVVLQENVDPGQVIGRQTNIASLAGTDRFWVQVSVPLDDLAWIDVPASPAGKGSPVDVIQDAGNATVYHKGYVIRLLSSLDNGRLARLLVAVEDPLMIRSGAVAGKMPLLLGSYVTARIEGEDVEGVYVIPRKALRDVEDVVEGKDVNHAWVWLMDEESRLEERKVSILWRGKEEVYVDSGLNDGERVITSTISTPVAGMKLSETNGNGTPE